MTTLTLMLQLNQRVGAFLKLWNFGICDTESRSCSLQLEDGITFIFLLAWNLFIKLRIQHCCSFKRRERQPAQQRREPRNCWLYCVLWHHCVYTPEAPRGYWIEIELIDVITFSFILSLFSTGLHGPTTTREGVSAGHGKSLWGMCVLVNKSENDMF